MRPGSPTIQASVRAAFGGREVNGLEEWFAATRELKDRKDYRALSESLLPLDQ
jgi:hypothetical protein